MSCWGGGKDWGSPPKQEQQYFGVRTCPWTPQQVALPSTEPPWALRHRRTRAGGCPASLLHPQVTAPPDLLGPSLSPPCAHCPCRGRLPRPHGAPGGGRGAGWADVPSRPPPSFLPFVGCLCRDGSRSLPGAEVVALGTSAENSGRQSSFLSAAFSPTNKDSVRRGPLLPPGETDTSPCHARTEQEAHAHSKVTSLSQPQP